MEVYREARARREARQAVTIARAIRAGRASARSTPAEVRHVDGAALGDLLGEVAADARLVDSPVNRKPWAGTGLRVAEGDQVTWLAWGSVNLIRPLGIVAPAWAALAGRVDAGSVVRSACGLG